MIILGIDPGTTRIGYGVVAYEGGVFKPIVYGVLDTNTPDKAEQFKRAGKELKKLIGKYKPDRAVVEKLFFANNQKTVMAVSEMRGVILHSIAMCGVALVEFTPLQVKQSISGYGKADKNQVQKMVRMILKINEVIKPDDAADALALAVCGATAVVEN